MRYIYACKDGNFNLMLIKKGAFFRVTDILRITIKFCPIQFGKWILMNKKTIGSTIVIETRMTVSIIVWPSVTHHVEGIRKTRIGWSKIQRNNRWTSFMNSSKLK